MEIRGATKYSKDLFRKVARFGLAKRRALFGAYLVLELFCLLLLGLMISADHSRENILDLLPLIIISVSFLLYIPFRFLIVPRISAGQNENLSGIENSFVFNDSGVSIFSKGPHSSSQDQISYEFFFKVYETGDCFYFYMTKASVHPLLKKDIEGSRAEDLRSLLMSKLPAGKYVMLKA